MSVRRIPVLGDGRGCSLGGAKLATETDCASSSVAERFLDTEDVGSSILSRRTISCIFEPKVFMLSLMDKKRNSYASVKKWRMAMKRRLVLCFGGACTICGLRDEPIVYDFHHLDPNEKDSLVTHKCRSWNSAVAEAKKCTILCSHCHRKLHSWISPTPKNITCV